MDLPCPDQHLSRIETLWSLVRQAHGPEAMAEAQQALWQRYSGAIYRYLLGALHDEYAADEVFQEFWLRFLRGAFRQANPERGRFRALVKSTLFHLVIDHQKAKARSPAQALEPQVFSDPADQDQAFLTSWRQEILERTWLALEQEQQQTRQPFFAVLRLRAEQPELTSEEMAARLNQAEARQLTAGGIRQILKRARTRFAELLVREVSLSLVAPTSEELEQEIRELGLLPYCRSALRPSQDT